MFTDVCVPLSRMKRRPVAAGDYMSRYAWAPAHHDDGSGEPGRIQVLDAARDVPEEDASAQRELAQPAGARAAGRGGPQHRHR